MIDKLVDSDVRESIEKENTGEVFRSRVRATDLISGLSIILCMISMSPGDYKEMPSWFNSSTWGSFSLYDISFAVFIFTFCFMIPLNCEFDIIKYGNRKKLFFKNMRVSISLIISGVILEIIKFGSFRTFNPTGAIQAAGIVYFVVYFLNSFMRSGKIKVRICSIVMIGIGVILSILYTVVGMEYGYRVDNNLAIYFDKLIFGKFMVDEFYVYGVSSMISLVSMGCIASGVGWIMASKVTNKDKSVMILISGMIFIIAALISEKFCPYNIQMWSGSLIYLVSGLYFIIFIPLYYIFDEKRNKLIEVIAMPFYAISMSPMFIYVSSVLVYEVISYIYIYSISYGSHVPLVTWISNELIGNIFSEAERSIVFSFVYVIIWAMVAVKLYVNKIYIKMR